MATKTIGVREEVYERLCARKRADESFTELIDRLIDEGAGDWRDGFGSLSAEDADGLRTTAETSRNRFDDASAERQARALRRFEDALAEDTDTDRPSENDS